MEKKIKNKEEQLKECEKLKSGLANAVADKDKYLAGWKRAQADFINYKKEERERTAELVKYSNEKIILKILPILDNIYIAEKKIPDDLKDNEWVRGLLQIKNQILDFLKIYEVKGIKSAGEKFNPEFHEAVEEVEDKNLESGIIIEEIKKGYIINNKVIRPARVKISK